MKGQLTYGIENSELETVISVLSENDKINKVSLFGSRAKGNFTTGSHIDLALQGENLVLNDILEASIEIDKLFLPYKFDLIIQNRIKEVALIEHIERVGITLFKR